MWFKNLRIFRLSSNWVCNAQSLESALEKQAFNPDGGSSHDMQRAGWVPASADAGLVYAQDGQYLICLRTEKKLLPASVINHFSAQKAQEIEEQQGYKPGRKQMKEIKERVTDELLPRAFSTYQDTRVWIDSKNHWLIVDAGSSAKSDEVLGMIAKVIDPFPVKPLYVNQSPSSVMTGWLLDESAPDSFCIDQDSELSSTSESGAKVRYVRQSLRSDDAQKHVKEGKQCTRLAMTWNDRVSFVLTDALEIKRVTPLDVIQSESTAENAQDQFSTDLALMTGELNGLLNALTDALGGERNEEQEQPSKKEEEMAACI